MELLLVDLLSNLFGIEGLEFANSDGLWLLFLWPLLWVLSGLNHLFGGVQNDDLTQLQSQRQLVVKHALIHKMQPFGSAERVLKWRFSVIKMGLNLLRGIIIMSLAVALAQPEKIQELAPLPQQKTVRDIVFVIESSASFLLPDYQVDGHSETRMNVVKNVLDQFISGLEGNRFGLAIYAEQAYTLMPLTSDQTAARLNLKRLKPYLAGRTDGAMGEALGLALKQTRQPPQNGRTKQTESDTLKRVVVLISDGLSQPSRLALSEVINYAQLLQVPIYTIGVGTNNQAADKRLYTGLLYQPLESGSLKAIASETQGQYFEIGSGQDLNRVLQKINKAEGVPYETPPRPPRHVALYEIPLSISVVSLLCYLFLSLLLANKLRSSSENQAVH